MSFLPKYPFPKVHIKGEVHELLREVLDGEDEEGDADGDGISAVVGTNPSVIADLDIKNCTISGKVSDPV